VKLLPLFVALILTACDQNSASSFLKEPMDLRNNPRNIPGSVADLEFMLNKLPETGKVERIWWGNWWPMSQGGTAARRYQGYPSPMEKYDAVTGGGSATSWEIESTRAYTNIGWAGHCNGLAAASVMVEEPTKSVLYKNTTFTTEDIKALLIESWQGSGSIIGDRCDRKQITYDRYGRILETECRDVNPATFHLAVTNYVGLFSKAIIADVDNSEAVWNYVIDSFTVQTKNWLSKNEATWQVQREASSTYVFNPEAIDFVHIKMTVNYVKFDTRSYEYILELNQNGMVIGGEWIGNNKREHPDFIWRPLDPQPENPYLDLNIINEIYRNSI